jgi:hypothetical protein
MKTKILRIFILLIILVLAGFLINRFFYPPISAKLPPPKEIPFFSVFYRDHMFLSKIGPIGFPASIPDKKEIEKDIKIIKEAGFEGIKLEFVYGSAFGSLNKITSWIAKKAAVENLYVLGLLSGHQSKLKGRAFNERELAQWENFVAKTVREHKSTIYFWEVWNEPDIDYFCYGSPKEYLELLKRTYQVIKRENPQAKVVIAMGSGYQESFDYLKELLSLGAGEYFDILGFHPIAGRPYFIQEPIIKDSIKRMKEIQSEYRNRWPLWITEIGQPSYDEIDEEKQAKIAEMLLKTVKENQVPVVWFHFSDEIPASEILGWGLVRGNNEPKPVLEVFKKFMK